MYAHEGARVRTWAECGDKEEGEVPSIGQTEVEWHSETGGNLIIF